MLRFIGATVFFYTIVMGPTYLGVSAGGLLNMCYGLLLTIVLIPVGALCYSSEEYVPYSHVDCHANNLAT